MEKNQIYVTTKEDLAKVRTQEKKRKNDMFLVVIAILLLIASLFSLFIVICAIIFLISIIIFWDNRPWLKVIRYQDISDLEIEYELAMQIENLKKQIRKNSILTNDLYQNIDPGNNEKIIQDKQKILDLDQQILSFIQEIFCIEDTLEISQSTELLVMKDSLLNEIECVKLHLKELKK